MKMNKRIIISESERQSILNLHTLYKNNLNEQVEPVTTATTTAAPTAGTPVVGRKVDCTSTKNPARCKQKVLDVQVKINDKCTKITQKLVEDGVYGNNTLNAIKTCTGMDLSSSGKTPVSGATATTATSTTGTTNSVVASGGDAGESSMEGV